MFNSYVLILENPNGESCRVSGSWKYFMFSFSIFTDYYKNTTLFSFGFLVTGNGKDKCKIKQFFLNGKQSEKNVTSS